MSLDHSMQTAMETMRKLQGLSERMAIMSADNDLHVKKWEYAQRMGNGVDESAERQTLHNIMDQLLDLRAEAIQLVKTFPS